MDRKDLVPHIRKSWTYAKAMRIEELFSGPTALEASESFKSLAVSPTASYEELYLAGMHDGQYNFLLRDFSFFQFGLGSVDGVRFAYYPNPFLGSGREAIAELNEMREYVAEGLIDVDEFLHRVSELRHTQHPPLVRYEYSKRQYREDTHPCSHMHIGFHGDNRWPVRRYLTAHAFTLLIFRLFYLDFWKGADSIRVGDKDLSLDATMESVREECRMLYADEFSSVEGRRFHFV